MKESKSLFTPINIKNSSDKKLMSNTIAMDNKPVINNMNLKRLFE